MQTTVAIVGGTGAEGSGLALRFALAGVRVRIGSRNPERAEATAQRISGATGTPTKTPFQTPESLFSRSRSPLRWKL